MPQRYSKDDRKDVYSKAAQAADGTKASFLSGLALSHHQHMFFL